MADIISFEKKENKSFELCMDKFHTASNAVMANPCRDTIGKMFETMSETIREAFKATVWEMQQEIPDEHTAAFMKKYKTVYTFMPKKSKDKIPYLARVMLRLVPVIFHDKNEDMRLQAFYEYGDFLYRELEPTMDEFEESFKKRRKTVPFPEFETVEEKDLEKAIRKCLEDIVSLSGEGEGKEEELLKALHRIFYLDAILVRKMTG